MSQPISAKHAAFEFKKTLILKVAAEQFFAHGFTKTRIDDIADALQVTKPFIYYHFPSKLHLLEEVCGHTSVFAADLAEAALDASVVTDVGQRFQTFVRQFLATVLEERMFLSIYFRESKYLPLEMQQRHREDRRRFHVALGRLLTEGRDQGRMRFTDLSVTGQTLTGMVTWVFNWYREDGPQSAEEVTELVANLVFAAVGLSTA